MRYAIQDTGPTCALTATENHNATMLPLPISGDDLRTAIRAMLLDPHMAQSEVGTVQLVRRPDAIAIISKTGSFSINWGHLTRLVA